MSSILFGLSQTSNRRRPPGVGMVGPSPFGNALAGVAHLQFSSVGSSRNSMSVAGMENRDERISTLQMGFAPQSNVLCSECKNG